MQTEAAAIDATASPEASQWALDTVAYLTDLDARVAALTPAPAPTPVPAPAPTPTPTPTSSIWAWDARTATVDAKSAAYVSAFQTYAVQTNAYLACDVATADATQTSPGYAIPGVTGLDATVYVPLGTKPGVSNDHHLTIRDMVHGREHDLYAAVYDPTSQRIIKCNGGVSFPLDAPAEILSKGNTNAAGFPLRRGIITPADIAKGVIDHPIVFSMPNPGPAPNRYPSTALYGYPNGTGFPLGTWMRLDPSVDVTALALPKLETLICVALQRYGMFLRDAGSDIAILAGDEGGGMASLAAWTAAGVSLNIGSPAWARKLSGIPWTKMQVLTPPAK